MLFFGIILFLKQKNCGVGRRKLDYWNAEGLMFQHYLLFCTSLCVSGNMRKQEVNGWHNHSKSMLEALH